MPTVETLRDAFKSARNFPFMPFGAIWGASAGIHIRRAMLTEKEKKQLKSGNKRIRRKVRMGALWGAIPGALIARHLGKKLNEKLDWKSRREWREGQNPFDDDFGGWRRAGHKSSFFKDPNSDIETAKRVLGLHGMKTKAEVMTKHRDLVKEFHPDVAKNKTMAHEKILKINEAWDTFRNSREFQKLAKLSLSAFTRLKISGEL